MKKDDNVRKKGDTNNDEDDGFFSRIIALLNDHFVHNIHLDGMTF